MIKVILNEGEKEILFRQSPLTGKDGGWQSLLVGLQRVLNEQTGEIALSSKILDRIQRYAFKYGNGGWEDRLRGIFERTLGPNLDGNI